MNHLTSQPTLTVVGYVKSSMPLCGISIHFIINPRPSTAGITAVTHLRQDQPMAALSGIMDTIHEECRPTSTQTVDIGFCPTIPEPFTYGRLAYAISESEYSQTDYETVVVTDLEHERRLFVLGLSNGLRRNIEGYPEDHIIIECPDNTNIACQADSNIPQNMVRLNMARAHLMHSGWFVKYFDSSHYLARAGMKVTWLRDPLACWEMAKCYMADGYDRYGKVQITRYVASNFRLADRFIVLVRLYNLAYVLDLCGLMEGAFGVLKEMESLILAPNVITLARIIFGGENYCRNIQVLKMWCLKWVERHHDCLIGSTGWHTVVKTSVPELQEQWDRIKKVKRMVSQQQLKDPIWKNVYNANAIFSTGDPVDVRNEGFELKDVSKRGNCSKRSVTPKEESRYTKIEWNRHTQPTKERNSSPDDFDLLNVQVTFSSDDGEPSEGNAHSKGRTRLFPLGSPSSEQISNDADSNASKIDNKLKAHRRFKIPRESAFQEIFDDADNLLRPAEKDQKAHRGSIVDRKGEYTGYVTGALVSSTSEPLLTPRPVEESPDSIRAVTIMEQHSDIFGPAIPFRPYTRTYQQEIGLRSNQRGVILTAEALYEPDRWPLADIPTSDPLLPIARRAPSLDREAAQLEYYNASTHQAQAVTVFGVHRPGMGGSFVGATENIDRGERRAGAANEMKIREFLGMNEPGNVGMIETGVHPSMKMEGRKLKKKAVVFGKSVGEHWL